MKIPNLANSCASYREKQRNRIKQSVLGGWGMLRFFIEPVSAGIWQYVLLPFVFLGGIYFTFRSRGFQFRRLGETFRETVGKAFRKEEKTKGSVSPFQAMTTALAGTLGTGSVIGTCQALALGGYGAIFWMWCAAFLGMVIKCFEVILAIRFRCRNEKGEWVGGPMYYILRGMGKRWKPLAVLFAVFASLAALGMGNLAQSNSIATSAVAAFSTFRPLGEGGERILAIVLGILCAGTLGAAIFGGIRRIGAVTEVLVPVASVLFAFLSIVVIGVNAERILPVFRNIVQSAFSVRALAGGGAGIAVKTAVHWGLRRSAFSNEAGLGSAAIAHAAAETDHPVRQGLYGIFEVFLDTIVVCTLTALAVAVSLPGETIASSTGADATLIIAAFATVFGGKASSLIVAASMIFFAFSTLLGWALYGSRCVEFLFGILAGKWYRILFVFCAFLGAVVPMETVWSLSDLFNGLMAIPNFIALFALTPIVLNLMADYASKNKKPTKRN